MMTNEFTCLYEWGVYPFKRGLKLIDLKKSKLNQNKASLYILADLFKLPINICFLDQQSRLQTCNEINLQFFHTDSLHKVYKKTAFEIFKNDHCKRLLENDHKVITHQKQYFFDGYYPKKEHNQKDEPWSEGLAIKLPWYNEQNQVIGIAGFTIIIHEHSFATPLTLISQLGLLNSEQEPLPSLPGLRLENAYLSRRESEILEYVIRGKSARLIALDLDISKRTVQSHIEHIKNKMGVANKAELIEKALDHLKFTSK